MDFRVALCACALVLLCDTSLHQDGDGCTSGFMSVDRMDDLLGNDGTVIPSEPYQGIFPEVGFTCSGGIDGWVFGAQWVGHDDRQFTELQIWRPTGDGAYTKVGNTTVTVTGSKTNGFYAYPLSSPLDFQAGDVVGYYQPPADQSQLRVYLEDESLRQNQTGYYYYTSGPASQLYLAWGVRSTRYQILVNVITNSTGCVKGFASVERIRLLLGVDRNYGITSRNGRQQISPEMKITCNGMITKWIIGADWTSSVSAFLYPELQVWRKIVNDTYVKISGTYIFVPFNNAPNRIYEYTKFAPIRVEAGDILGIFIPPHTPSRLRLRSERDNSNNPKVYYHFTASSVTSTYDEIDLGNNESSMSTASYYPMVSLEIVRASVKELKVVKSVATSIINLTKPTMKPTAAEQSSTTGNGVSIIIGVTALVIVLIVATTLILIFVTLLLRRRTKTKELPVTTENAAYGIAQAHNENIELKDNILYTSV